jgi:hypothetical protein|tara:strand:+ start:15425 stop:15652 length:228 start_codon:yes stop_codon:yes gene_type:complete
MKKQYKIIKQNDKDEKKLVQVSEEKQVAIEDVTVVDMKARIKNIDVHISQLTGEKTTIENYLKDIWDEKKKKLKI